MLKKNEKAITLVALVVTIIVLVILATISITLVLDSDGIIGQAKKAKGLAQNDQVKTDEALNMIYNQIANGGNGENLPDNNEDTESGTIVKLPEGWQGQTVRQVSLETGKDITDSTKVATVYAVAVGNGQEVPVPYGFWYVGGNLDTGVIISDKEEDAYTKTGKDMSSYEDSFQLKGNQFVFIPCTIEEYVKKEWGIQNSNWDTTTPSIEKRQIEKYGGFYVGRYEAGLAKDIPEFTTRELRNGNNQIYNKAGVPQSKPGQIPWNFIDWTKAKENAEVMYKTSCVSSGLITGTQWDVILNKLIEQTDLTETDMKDSKNWGNYQDDTLTFNGDYSVYASSYQYPFGDTSITGYNLYKTGMNKEVMKYGISDIAGNVGEWTEESSTWKTTGQYRVLRGGGYHELATKSPACYRHGTYDISYTVPNVGFRVALYMR